MNNVIMFVHQGNQDYFKIVLKQAKKTNEQNKIVVIGNRSFKKIKGIEFYNIKNFKNSFSQIYKHYSPNPYNFELFCFERWFIIKDFMIENKLDYVFACDSDLMIYANLYEDISLYKNYLACFCSTHYQENFRWSASGHISFWTLEGIKKFCAFIEEYYTTDKINILFQKVNYHNSNNVPGGICDMTLLYLFYLENKDHIKNLLIVDNDHAFDDNINVSENYYKDEYEFNLTKKVKNIKFINKKPYCNNLILNKDINFKVLHFQNGAKNIINNYYDADGILEIIQIKILYSLKILLKNILIKIKSLIKSVLNILIMFYRRIFNKN